MTEELLTRLRDICLALPEAYEEQAWVGTRWRVRSKTFAHVLVIDDGWPAAYAKASGIGGLATLLMFRSSPPELDALRNGGAPFFAPPWRADEVGMVVDGDVDLDEVGELLTDSYCVVAPKRLAATIERPRDS